MDFNEMEPAGDLFVNEPRLVPASHGKRLANYFIDQIGCVLFLVIVILALRAIGGPTSDRMRETLSAPFTGNLLVTFLYSFLMSVQESVLRGKSLGKLITRTRAIQEDGNPMTTEKAFLRNLIRLVPFNPLSALGNPARPWHDRWSHTIVIDEDAA
jgi:uncharacterized RDD family membrane protein YckC